MAVSYVVACRKLGSDVGFYGDMNHKPYKYNSYLEAEEKVNEIRTWANLFGVNVSLKIARVMEV